MKIRFYFLLKKMPKNVVLLAFSVSIAGFFYGSLSYFENPKIALADSIDRAEAELRKQLEKLEEEARILEESLNQKKQETATISRDVSILSDQIRRAQVEVEKKNLEIKNLTSTINLKQQTISELEAKSERARNDLVILIRKTNESDQVSLPEIILSNRNLSDFFREYDSYKLAQNQLEKLFDNIREIQARTAEEKSQLESAKNKEADAKYVIEIQKQNIAIKKDIRDKDLAVSKQSEAAYQAVLEQRRAQASSIRTALFQLRDGTGISFGDALRYAEKASKATGVRAAFILGILKQETDIGKHLGSCTIYDLESGKSKGVNTGRIFNQGIHPTRDLPLLQTILKELGQDPLTTRISCPLITELAGEKFSESGYGGAMGPSQFIPSTWQLYIPRLRQIFGTYPNPWNPEHAVMGTGLLLKDNGAAAGGYTAERTAALRYYAGGNWNVPANAFYGNGVMVHTEEMQRQIDFLNDVAND